VLLPVYSTTSGLEDQLQQQQRAVVGDASERSLNLLIK